MRIPDDLANVHERTETIFPQAEANTPESAEHLTKRMAAVQIMERLSKHKLVRDPNAFVTILMIERRHSALPIPSEKIVPEPI